MAVFRTLEVKVRPPYPVLVGEAVLSDVAEHIGATDIALIADKHVYALHGERVLEALEAGGKRVVTYPYPGGEAHKTLFECGRLLERLSCDGFDRRSAVVALGGGVTGDVAGFVAACYLRGVAFYNLPTSLLAMVDASVGGKTGVNLPQGKNLVGAFWQPGAVGIDTDFLRSLPARDFRQGAVELYKHGLLADESILEAFQDTPPSPNDEAATLSDLIARSVAVKAEIVAQDEREAGVRAHLNLGHTLAHALEAASAHRLGHGDAVAYGLLYNAFLAARRGDEDLRERVLEFVRWVAPAPLPELAFGDLTPFFQRDKKTLGGKVRFVLLRAAGEPYLADDLSETELRAAWHALQEAL